MPWGRPSDRRIGILRQIGALGSISRAARAVGVSCKAAWQAVDTLTNLAGVALVERVVGGAGGGGRAWTPAGLELLAAADAMAQARSAVLQRLQQPAPPGREDQHAHSGPCVVESVERLGPIARCICRRPEPERWPCRWHRASPQKAPSSLGLQPGQALLALCKATAVRAMPYAESPAAGAELVGRRVTRLSRGPEVDEVAAQLNAACRWWALHRQAAACGRSPGSSCRYDIGGGAVGCGAGHAMGDLLCF